VFASEDIVIEKHEFLRIGPHEHFIKRLSH
jgi:hypothetical protein